VKDKEFSARKIVWISLQNGKEIFLIRFGLLRWSVVTREPLLVTTLQRCNGRKIEIQKSITVLPQTFHF